MIKGNPQRCIPSNRRHVVVVSLWRVDDQATAEFMARFYKAMLNRSGQSPASALRQAQLEMLKDKRWQSPYFWAGFVLQGEWR
jgi:CHAT domain-containing protein